MNEFTDYCAWKGLSEEGTNKLKLVHFMKVYIYIKSFFFG